MKPIISIIIPMFNSGAYIERTLKSVLSQTFSNYEVLVIDDGSNDGSYSLVQSYIKTENRVKIIRQPRLGVSSARNKGLEMSNGEYIVFVDADDYIKNDFLENMYISITKHNVEIVVCNYAEYRNKKLYNDILDIKANYIFHIDNKHAFFANYISGELKNKIAYSVCNKIYKKEIISLNKINFDESLKMSEDLIFNIKYFSVINNILFIKETYYCYNINVNSSIHKLSNQIFKDYQFNYDVFVETTKSLVNKNTFEKVKASYLLDVFNGIMYRIIINADKIKDVNKYLKMVYSSNLLASLKKQKLKNISHMRRLLYFTLLNNKRNLLSFLLFTYMKLRKIIKFLS
jgi:glycosyltransferase involved in cell wall biosynthesis